LKRIADIALPPDSDYFYRIISLMEKPKACDCSQSDQKKKEKGAHSND